MKIRITTGTSVQAISMQVLWVQLAGSGCAGSL